MTSQVKLTAVAGLATLLGSISLYPLFTSTVWFANCLGMVAVVTGVSALARRLRLPSLVTPLISAAAAVYYLTVSYARDEALWGLLPTAAALDRLGELVLDGVGAARHYAAPVPPTTEITMITAAGVGIVAVLVDWIAVGQRRVALAGLPLLVLYSVPVAIQTQGVGELAFGIGAAGYLALLLVDRRERISRWGRPVQRRTDGDQPRMQARPDVSSLGATGRRVGLAAVAVAVALPLLVPELTPRLLFSPGTWGSLGGGQNSITTPNPMVSLKRDLVQSDGQVVLRYRTSETDPSYLRMYALDTFNGRSWSMSKVNGRPEDRVSLRDFPTPQGLDGDVRTKRVTTRISVSRDVRGMRFLPLPYPPSHVSIKGDWRFVRPSLMVFSTSDFARGKSYNVTSLQVMPSEKQLTETGTVPDQVAKRYLHVPDAVPDNVHALARRVTREATTPYDKAMALQEWFTETGNFTYSLDVPPGNSSAALTNFLLRSRTGYCEQFAASMALMARLVGVPARVAVGYTAGHRNTSGTWSVTTSDAHAWPELYFDGIGWLRFEPTPNGPTGQGSARLPEYAQPEQSGSNDSDAGATNDSGPTASPNAPGAAGPNHQRGMNRYPTTPGDAATSEGNWLIRGLGGGLTAVAIVTCWPLLVRRVQRRRRWARGRDPAGRAHAAWLELRDDVIDLGLAWQAGDSPRAAARRLAGTVKLTGPAAAALSRVVRAEERARYAPTPADDVGLTSDSRLLRGDLAASVSRWARWRARIFPRSTLRGLGRLGSRISDAVAWAENLPSRLWRLLPTRPHRS